VEVIRTPATAAEWDQATALLHDYVEWFRAAAGIDLTVEQPAFADELAALADHYRSDDRRLFVAFRGNLAVGTIAVAIHPGGTAELKRTYVRAVARGGGLADRLVQHALTDAARHGCASVWLETMPGPMDRAIEVYRRNGFAVVGDIGRTLHLAGLVIMQRELSELSRIA
jgi:GNAT superfamily N-acetyltransferase